MPQMKIMMGATSAPLGKFKYLRWLPLDMQCKKSLKTASLIGKNGGKYHLIHIF